MNKKEVSPVIAVMLLVAVAVAACGAYFIWYKSFKAGSQIESETEVKNPDVFIGTAEEVKREIGKMEILNEAISGIERKYKGNINYSERTYNKGKMTYEVLITDFKPLNRENAKGYTKAEVWEEHMYFLTLRINSNEYKYIVYESGTIYFEGVFDWYSILAEET